MAAAASVGVRAMRGIDVGSFFAISTQMSNRRGSSVGKSNREGERPGKFAARLFAVVPHALSVHGEEQMHRP